MLYVLLFVVNLNTVAINQLLADSALQDAHVGVCIYSFKKDRVVYNLNIYKYFIPASTQKIFTTAAALHYLGSDFKYITRFKIRGKIEASTLMGDVILQGSGDPSIKNCDFLERWIDRLRQLKIHTIVGDVLIDDGIFSQERLPEGWAWHYLDARYAPEISAFSFNSNVVRIDITPGENVGDLASVTMYPQTGYVELKNDLKTVEDTLDQGLKIYRKPEVNVIYVQGQIAQKCKPRTIEVAVKDPTLFAGYLFKEWAERKGIRVYGYPKRYNVDSSNFRGTEQVLDSVVSGPLSDIIIETNKESKNLYAENLLKSIGYYVDRDGSYATSILLLKKFLSRIGADTNTIHPVDGSGLSRHNLLSPYSVVLVLRYMYLSKYRNLFFESLPRANEGTLFGRLINLNSTVRAKTGTLKWTSCISGFVESPLENDVYAFSILINNFTGNSRTANKLQERIIEEIVN